MDIIEKYGFLLVLSVACASAFASTPAGETAPLSVADMMKRPLYYDMKISPGGQFVAATVPVDDNKTGLTVIDLDSMKVTAAMSIGDKQHVDDFYWVTDTRLLLSAAIREGSLAQPIPTGELFTLNADGSGWNLIFGYRAGSSGFRTGVKAERASAYPLSRWAKGNQVVIQVVPWTGMDGSFSEARRLNINSGRTVPIVTSPLRNGRFLLDRDENVRISWGDTIEHVRQVHHRSPEGSEWQLIHDERKAGYAITPLAFDADGRTLLVEREHPEGSSGIYRMSLDNGELAQVYRHPEADTPGRLMGREPGQLYAVIPALGNPPELGFLESTDHPGDARLARSLQAAFPGQRAYITSITRDGKRAIVATMADQNPGEFFLFELESMRASHLASAREWLPPARLGVMRPIVVPARDGTKLHGLLQLPPGVTEPKRLPLVVNPHGGPHGPFDSWGFDSEAQLLASRGYAVLKVNFRGSGGFGAAFERAGYREWGGKVQDDIVDATRWVIEQGYADGERVCIYGGSFGGYSALMSAARYPEVFKCAIGYAGVYDLNLMYKDGDVRQSLYGRNYLKEVIGQDENLVRFSPVTYADRIKIPVFLIHGGEDERVPIAHANRMRSALKAAGNEPRWLLERREGHGFYRMGSIVGAYEQILAFLDENIGGKASEAFVRKAD